MTVPDVHASVCGKTRGGQYLMSGTRLRRQIGPEESIPNPLERSTKSFLLLSSPLLTLVDPTNQQGSVLTSNLASISSLLPTDLSFRTTEGGNNKWYSLCQMSKPLPHIAAAFQKEQTAPSGPHWILLRFSKCSSEARFVSVQKTMQRYKVIFRNKMCKHFQMCSSKCIAPRAWMSFA